MKLSRPDNPVTLPTFDDVPAIEDGLPIESGTLKVFNYQEYISPDVLAAFEEEFGVTVEVTTFISMDEAIAKLSSGDTQFDVFFPTADVIGKVAAGKLLQPLNKIVHPQHRRTSWESLQDPFYDKGGVYTVPYTLFTTGHRLPHRRRRQDARHVRQPVRHLLGPGQQRPGVPARGRPRGVRHGAAAARRDRRQHRGRRADRRRAGRRDELNDLVNVKLGAEAYTVLPEKRTWVHQAWSGDVVNAQYYLPEGETIDNIGYWYPRRRRRDDRQRRDRGDARRRDARCSPTRSSTTCSTTTHSIENYGWLGYQPPQNDSTPTGWSPTEYVPAHLASRSSGRRTSTAASSCSS